MLITRVLTAVVLLGLVAAVLYSGSFELLLVVTAAFFAAATWESARLFHSPRPTIVALIWLVAFVLVASQAANAPPVMLFAVSLVIWVLRFAPALAYGLPALNTLSNRLVGALYTVSLLACFTAIVVLYQRAAAYLLSVLAIVWVADIGAYFVGKAFGRHKLAPAISPGKSWEGALGGWVFVLVLGVASVNFAPLAETFAPLVQARWGWLGLLLLLTLIVAASIIGDLFESQLKRRAKVKDSSALLPGHGGVLDRVDALVPALPLAVLAQFSL